MTAKLMAALVLIALSSCMTRQPCEFREWLVNPRCF